MTSTVALRLEGAWHNLAKHRNRKEGLGKSEWENGQPGAGTRETGLQGQL